MNNNGNTVATIVPVLAALSPFLAALLGLVGLLYRHERERREAVEHQLSEHKYKAYVELLEIFFDLMKSIKADRKIPQAKLTNRMIDASKDLMVYGSDEVVAIYQQWLKDAREGKPGGLTWFGDLVVAIRRDMGHTKTKITSDQILRQLITDYDQAKLQGLIDKDSPA
jgi:predicted DNA-binding ribbon-helix-helix protein